MSAYPRTLAVLALVLLGLVAAFTDHRVAVHAQLLPVFEWMETTPLGVAGKTWGGVFAVVQALHLLSMALLGGAVLAADTRLLGFAFRDVPLANWQAQCDRLFDVALVMVVLSGVFMACGVAVKIYYLPVYWYKMLALATGVLFVYCIRRPLLRQPSPEVSAGLHRLVAIASLMIWFSVAATGRWIGFS